MWKDKIHSVEEFISVALQANVAQASIFSSYWILIFRCFVGLRPITKPVYTEDTKTQDGDIQNVLDVMSL